MADGDKRTMVGKDSILIDRLKPENAAMLLIAHQVGTMNKIYVQRLPNFGFIAARLNYLAQHSQKVPASGY